MIWVYQRVSGCVSNKVSLHSKQGFFALQTRLLYDANKASFKTHFVSVEKQPRLSLLPPYYIIDTEPPFPKVQPTYKKPGDSMAQTGKTHPICRQQTPQTCETMIQLHLKISVEIHCVRTQFIWFISIFIIKTIKNSPVSWLCAETVVILQCQKEIPGGIRTKYKRYWKIW